VHSNQGFTNCAFTLVQRAIEERCCESRSSSCCFLGWRQRLLVVCWCLEPKSDRSECADTLNGPLVPEGMKPPEIEREGSALQSRRPRMHATVPVKRVWNCWRRESHSASPSSLVRPYTTMRPLRS
jgi:hypothetical protein